MATVRTNKQTPAWALAIARHSSLFVPLAFIMLLAVIVVPLPPMLLDALIAINISIAVIMLMTTVYLEEPLQFSVFPSLLLGTTLMRLVLNIASTRLILSNGHTGTDAAGRVIEAFGGSGDKAPIPVKDVEEVLRLEYRSKLLNPKWRDAMLDQGSGGAYEISQRMTAMIGWSATAEVDNFVFDQACERYALDEEVAKKLQRSNPEAFKNVVRRLLEAAGRGMWSTDDDTLDRLRDMYGDADDLIEQSTSLKSTYTS